MVAMEAIDEVFPFLAIADIGPFSKHFTPTTLPNRQ